MSNILDISVFDELVECDELYRRNSQVYDSIVESSHRLLSEMRNRINPTESNSVISSIIEQSKFTSELPKTIPNYLKIEENDRKKILSACNGVNNDYISIMESLGYEVPNRSDVEWQPPQKPCIAALGQVKAGKSCLVNCLLNDRVVIQAERRMTARVTYITHCPVKFVAEVQSDRIRKIDVHQDLKISDVELDFMQRDDVDKVGIELKIGRNNPILSYGFSVIDSPGLNENTILNDIIVNMIEKFSPIIVYVIDGRKSLTEEDARDIRDIKYAHPDLRIIYFVTKLDRSKYDKRRRPNDDEIDVAKRRLKTTFQKLKQYGFVPQHSEWDDCEDFHGASLWSIMDLLDTTATSKRNVTELDQYNGKQFNRFQICLVKTIRQSVEAPLQEAVDSLKLNIHEVIEKLINLGNNAKVLGDKFCKLKEIKSLENELFENQLNEINSRLYSDLVNMIGKNENLFAERIRNSEISPEICQKLKNSRNPEVEAPDHYRELQHQLRKTFEVALNTELKSFMTTFMSKKEEFLRGKLQSIVDTFLVLDDSEQSIWNSASIQSFRNVLTERLLFDYDFRFESENENVQRRQMAGTQLKQVYQALKKIFPSDSDPNFDDIKNRQILILLSDAHRKQIAGTITETIRNQFESKHDHFIKQLDKHEKILSDKLKQDQEQSSDFNEHLENFAFLYAKCIDIKTKYSIKIVDSEELRVKPNGSHVYKCTDNKGRSLLKYVLKTMTKSDERRMFGKEVYYTNRMKQSLVINLYGLNIEEEGMKTFCETYCEYIPFDCLTFLNQPNLEEAQLMQLIIGIASMINSLTEMNIDCRNLLLENILIKTQPKLQPVLYQFGLLEDENTTEHSVIVENAPTFARFVKTIVDKQKSNFTSDCLSSIDNLIDNCINTNQPLTMRAIVDQLKLQR